MIDSSDRVTAGFLHVIHRAVIGRDGDVYVRDKKIVPLRWVSGSDRSYSPNVMPIWLCKSIYPSDAMPTIPFELMRVTHQKDGASVWRKIP